MTMGSNRCAMDEPCLDLCAHQTLVLLPVGSETLHSSWDQRKERTHAENHRWRHGFRGPATYGRPADPLRSPPRLQIRRQRYAITRSAPIIPTITAFERSPDRGQGLARDMRVRWALEEGARPSAVGLLRSGDRRQ